MDNMSIYNIFGTMRGEINDFLYQPIEVVPGYLFNQYDTIKRCHLYVNSKFLDGNQYQGRDKIFFNIVKYRRDIAAKFLNIDSKDIRLWEMNPKSKWSTFLFEKELKLWMKKNKIGKLLNDCAVEAPTFGTVVLRKTKNGAVIEDLRRFFLDPTVENVQKSRFVTVKHILTESELKAKVKDGWDPEVIDKMIEDNRNLPQQSYAPNSYEKNSMTNIIRSSPYFEVYERFGEVPAKWLDESDDSGKLVRSLFIVYQPFSVYKDDNGNYAGEQGRVLFKSKWQGPWPFKDYHYTKTMGRWLGIGVIEDLFEAQERRNELANQKRISMEISSIHLFQTTGKNVVNNILSDLKSGDLIEAGPDGLIQPVANEERNLNAFASEEEQYDALADKQSFATSQAAGEALQASTPATNAVISQNNTLSLFGFKRENFGLFIQEFFVDFVLDDLYKQLSDEHILRFAGTQEEIQALDQAYVEALTNKWVIDTVLTTGKVPPPEVVDFKKQDFMMGYKKEGSTRFVNIKEGFYDDIEFEFDILVTSEQENVATLAQNTFQILTAIAQNPNLLQDPIAKTLLFSYAEKIGVNPLKLDAAEAQSQVQAPQQANLPSPLPGGGQPPVGQGATVPSKLA